MSKETTPNQENGPKIKHLIEEVPQIKEETPDPTFGQRNRVVERRRTRNISARLLRRL